jgi:4-hydroxythreonine-4-phosphate dehydrogenase
MQCDEALGVKPIAITLGDPAGIGPEVAAKTLAANPEPRIPWLLVGPRWALERGANSTGAALPGIRSVGHPEELDSGVALYDTGTPEPEDFRFGKVQASCGEAAVRAVEWAAHGCLGGELGAMVTCPLNKEAIHAAGYTDDLGHQEILARLAGVEWTATMLMTPGLRVAHLSTHKSLIKAAQYVTKDNVLSKLELVHQTLSRWGLEAPRIAVAALNPHGGEGGILGREEIDELAPAVALAQAQGMNVTGPLPADSVFNRAIDGEFDVVLALYHDQGHIAIKVHNFHESTTATLGIPFVRTSVDHGTAFDIAGQGIADETGLKAAIRAAERIVAKDLANL